MKKIVRLTESDLTRIIRRIINEQNENIERLDRYALKQYGGDKWYVYDIRTIKSKRYKKLPEDMKDLPSWATFCQPTFLKMFSKDWSKEQVPPDYPIG